MININIHNYGGATAHVDKGSGMLLVHYGANKYNPGKLNAIKNAGWGVKPEGGLWTSPVDSKYGWIAWCQAEGFREDALDESFSIKLDLKARILKIDSLADLYTTLDKYPRMCYGHRFPDWELLAKDYDAVWLTEAGQRATRMPKEHARGNLYGWDCETVLVLNRDCFSVL